ncbi:MAG: DUF2550 family protein [Actinophytocola sp.]|nr:DUF2550 family protein [Actinophytocola sp.]
MEITLVIIGLLAAVSVVFIWGAFRWRKVLKLGGINVALRWNAQQADLGWHLGIGRYQGEQFVWYRVMSLRRGPDKVLNRDDLEIADRREPTGPEVYALPVGATVLRCESSTGDPLEIAMAAGPLTGFLSWLESAPPGRQVPRAS